MRPAEQRRLRGPPRGGPPARAGVPRIPSPASRVAFSADQPRAPTAASMAEADWPSASASTTVQRPVPFCPAWSRITSTSGPPVAGSTARSTAAVISTR